MSNGSTSIKFKDGGGIHSTKDGWIVHENQDQSYEIYKNQDDRLIAITSDDQIKDFADVPKQVISIVSKPAVKIETKEFKEFMEKTKVERDAESITQLEAFEKRIAKRADERKAEDAEQIKLRAKKDELEFKEFKGGLEFKVRIVERVEILHGLQEKLKERNPEGIKPENILETIIEHLETDKEEVLRHQQQQTQPTVVSQQQLEIQERIQQQQQQQQ